MVQAPEKYLDEEKLMMILGGTSYAAYVAYKDKENYLKYSKYEIAEFSKETLRDMMLLEILDKLGYPKNELGTYLYKDLIALVYDKIKDIKSRRDIDKCRALMSDLTNAFSPLYHYIAREDKEMGIKSFHLYIQRAIENIASENIDEDLSKSIFGENPEEKDYGMQAFQIAAYAAEKYECKDVKEYKQPKVKKLQNMPDDIRLKDGF